MTTVVQVAAHFTVAQLSSLGYLMRIQVNSSVQLGLCCTQSSAQSQATIDATDSSIVPWGDMALDTFLGIYIFINFKGSKGIN